MSRLGSKRTPEALGLKGCPGASIHRIAEKRNSRKPISRCLHKVAPQADVMGRYALYSHLPQPQDIGGVYKDSKIAPSVVYDLRALPVVIVERQAHEVGFRRVAYVWVVVFPYVTEL